MNGIIHNCTHSSGEDIAAWASITEEQKVLKIFQYIDNLFNIIKPRKLLFMAVDGVAPRAKMNQQRQRRFKSALEAKESLEKLKSAGISLPDSTPLFDSNCITPGTEFMARLSNHLKFFIQKKITEDRAWASITIIFSGHEVPGEGEHKIMEYMRHYKAQPNWNPNQVHCLYGLDADLIMLSLVSHEPHFALLREEVLIGRKKPTKKGERQQFHLLHISLLREYLGLEFSGLKSRLSFPFDLERIVDDFVLFCYFVGNDFVPSLPGLDIADSSLDEFFTMYKEILPTLDGYLMEDGVPVMRRLVKVFAKLGENERAYFTEFSEDIEKVSRQILSKNKEQGALANVLYGGGLSSLNLSTDSVPDADDDLEWKNMYYRKKFQQELDSTEFHKKLQESYLEAIFWVAHYYFHGCVSWSWYYPYHYTPLAIDLVNYADFSPKFSLDQPFRPLEQLLGVLPPASSSLLPAPYRRLMMDVRSPLNYYYPGDFIVDLDGKKQSWEGIVLIPFINEKLLLDCTREINEQAELTEEERNRNKFGKPEIYTLSDNISAVSSTLPQHIESIAECTAKKSNLEFPSYPAGVHPFRLLTGTIIGKGSPPGIPSLLSLPIVGIQAMVGVTIFGNNRSRKESLLLKLPEPEVNQNDIFPLASQYLGKSCWLWPHNKQVFVESMANVNMECKVGEYPFKLTGEQCRSTKQLTNYIQAKWRTSKAVEVDCTVVANVRQIIGIKFDQNGRVEKRWSSVVDPIPFGSLLMDCPTTDDPRFAFRNLSFIERFPLKSMVILSTDNLYGSLGKVVGHYVGNNRNDKNNKNEKGKPKYDKSGMETEKDVHRQIEITEVKTGTTTIIATTTNTATDLSTTTTTTDTTAPTGSASATITPTTISPTTISPTIIAPAVASTATASIATGSAPTTTTTTTPTSTNINAKEKKEVHVEIIEKPVVPPLLKEFAAANSEETYHCIHKVARMLEVSNKTLSKITASVKVNPGNLNLGLNIKFSAKNQQVLGFTRRRQLAADRYGPWEYSEKAVQVLQEYKKRYPEVFMALEEDPDAVAYQISSIFKNPDKITIDWSLLQKIVTPPPPKEEEEKKEGYVLTGDEEDEEEEETENDKPNDNVRKPLDDDLLKTIENMLPTIKSGVPPTIEIPLTTTAKPEPQPQKKEEYQDDEDDIGDEIIFARKIVPTTVSPTTTVTTTATMSVTTTIAATPVTSTATGISTTPATATTTPTITPTTTATVTPTTTPTTITMTLAVTPTTTSLSTTTTEPSTTKAASTNQLTPTLPIQSSLQLKIAEMKAWLSSLPSAKLPVVVCGSSALSKDKVRQLQTLVDQWQDSKKENKAKKVLKLPPETLLSPIGNYEAYSTASSSRDDGTAHHLFNLCDRVIYLRGTGPCPFGSTGTVIAVKGNFVDVLFDKKIIGGINFDGACSDMRGQVIAKEALLNLTHRFPDYQNNNNNGGKSGNYKNIKRHEYEDGRGRNSRGRGKNQLPEKDDTFDFDDNELMSGPLAFNKGPNVIPSARGEAPRVRGRGESNHKELQKQPHQKHPQSQPQQRQSSQKQKATQPQQSRKPNPLAQTHPLSQRTRDSTDLSGPLLAISANVKKDAEIHQEISPNSTTSEFFGPKIPLASSGGNASTFSNTGGKKISPEDIFKLPPPFPFPIMPGFPSLPNLFSLGNMNMPQGIPPSQGQISPLGNVPLQPLGNAPLSPLNLPLGALPGPLPPGSLPPLLPGPLPNLGPFGALPPPGQHPPPGPLPPGSLPPLLPPGSLPPLLPGPLPNLGPFGPFPPPFLPFPLGRGGQPLTLEQLWQAIQLQTQEISQSQPQSQLQPQPISQALPQQVVHSQKQQQQHNKHQKQRVQPKSFDSNADLEISGDDNSEEIDEQPLSGAQEIPRQGKNRGRGRGRGRSRGGLRGRGTGRGNGEDDLTWQQKELFSDYH